MVTWRLGCHSRARRTLDDQLFTDAVVARARRSRVGDMVRLRPADPLLLGTAIWWGSLMARLEGNHPA